MAKHVLIAGAGPVGLAGALELHRRGFAVRIIDAGQGPSEQSKAIAVNPRTLALMEPCGATERLLAAGRRLKGANLYFGGKQAASLDSDVLERRYDFILGLPQSETERIFIALLAERGIEVEWGVALEHVLDHSGPVQARLSGAGIRPQVLADYLLGADGAHSTVRKRLNIAFPGKTYENEFSLADVRVDGPYDLDRLHLMERDGALFALIPVEEDIVRFICDRDDVLERAPQDIEQKEVVWQSTFQISQRRAEAFRRGNVFLAGDAAHIHSPAGGRGMNLGIEDVCWLAWLLKRGEAGRYQELRKPVAEDVLALTDRITRTAVSPSVFARLMRRRLLPLALKFETVQRAMMTRIAGLDTPEPEWLDEDER